MLDTCIQFSSMDLKWYFFFHQNLGATRLRKVKAELCQLNVIKSYRALAQTKPCIVYM
jgi:hypothetical protein